MNSQTAPPSSRAMEDFLYKNESERHDKGINKVADLVRRGSNGKLPQHYWVNRYGLAYNVATIPINPGKKRNGKRAYKYLGFTFDNDFPKKLNTGRILFEDKKKLPKVPKN